MVIDTVIPEGHSGHTTDIILIDIISFSQLNSQQQIEIITFLTKSYTKMIENLLVNSEMTLSKMILGFISTGDGFYCILNPRLKGFGTVLGLGFSHFSEIIAEKYPYFRGIRIAVHTGKVYQFTDILGNDNFVGDGLNDSHPSTAQLRRARDFAASFERVKATRVADRQLGNVRPRPGGSDDSPAETGETPAREGDPGRPIGGVKMLSPPRRILRVVGFPRVSRDREWPR